MRNGLAAGLVLTLLAALAGAESTPTAADRTGVSGPTRILEIRSYNLEPGTGPTFEMLFRERARPLLDEWNVDVVAFGRSRHDENSWFLMRAFDDLESREALETAFYGSEQWRNGPRQAILDCIDSYTTIVLPFDEAAIDALREALL